MNSLLVTFSAIKASVRHNFGCWLESNCAFKKFSTSKPCAYHINPNALITHTPTWQLSCSLVTLFCARKKEFPTGMNTLSISAPLRTGERCVFTDKVAHKAQHKLVGCKSGVLCIVFCVCVCVCISSL